MKRLKENTELSTQKTGIKFPKIPYNTGIELPIVLTPAQASKQTGLSKNIIQRAMNAGLLRSIRLTGKERSIRLKDLRAWLNGETQSGQKNENEVQSQSLKEILERDSLQKLETIDNHSKQERNMENER